MFYPSVLYGLLAFTNFSAYASEIKQEKMQFAYDINYSCPLELNGKKYERNCVFLIRFSHRLTSISDAKNRRLQKIQKEMQNFPDKNCEDLKRNFGKELKDLGADYSCHRTTTSFSPIL